jgi:hypothetical protein
MEKMFWDILEIAGSAIVSTCIAYVALRERLLRLEIKQEYMEASIKKGHETMDDIKRNLEQMNKTLTELKTIQQHNNNK